MSFEGITDSETGDVEYTREILAVKMKIQREVMEAFLGKSSSTELKDTWINSYSAKFRNFFKQRMSDETFLEKAKNDLETTIEEFVIELRKIE